MQLIFILKLSNFIKSIFSIIIINFLIIFNSKKVILFYFPRKDLTLKDLNYITDMLDSLKNKCFIIYGHKLNMINKKKFFFINEGFLKYLLNVDLFISNYICDNFPKLSKKIYIHHSLYDTPLTGKKREKETINRLKKYDYIFLSSKNLVESFSNIYLKNYNKKIQIKSTGYPRFDYFNKIIPKKKDSIIIATANFIAYPDHTIINYIEKIIEVIKKNSKFNIIFRPHPANRLLLNNNNQNLNINKILSKYSKDKKVLLDFSEDYSKTYARSLFMITDLSGTAFTYSFLTNCPVIFYSPKEHLFKKNYKNLNHYKDRKKIGYIAKNINGIDLYIKELLSNPNKYKKSISILRKKIDYLGKSKLKTLNEIKNIIKI